MLVFAYKYLIDKTTKFLFKGPFVKCFKGNFTCKIELST